MLLSYLVPSSVKSGILILSVCVFLNAMKYAKQNKTGKTENSTYLNFFLFPLLWSPVSFLHFTIRYFEQSVLVIFSSFHTCSSTPVVRILLASLKRLLSWTDLQLELALQGFCAVTYAWPLASLRPVVLLILSPFFSELFLPWPLWWWPCLVLLPQWLFSSLLHPSQAHVPQSRAGCKCYQISVSYLFSTSI